MLKFKRIGLDEIGAQTALKDRQWGNLTIILEDTETDHMRAIELNVMLPKRPDATMSELEEVARTEGITTLEAALELLRESSLAELAAREED